MRSTAVSFVIFAAFTVLAMGDNDAPAATYTKVKPVEKIDHDIVVAAPKKVVVVEVADPPPPPAKKIIVEESHGGKKGGSAVVVSVGNIAGKAAIKAAPTPTPAPEEPTPTGSSRRGGGGGAAGATRGAGGIIGRIMQFKQSKFDAVKGLLG
ncbi:hypothetical protein BSKO_09327 [Bryopsis sp. KO-2023]|nr:hypothetical protein BSKO_09327 [Bryopsis sp. KO-2023]